MTPSLFTLFGKSINDFFSAKILALTLFPALFGIMLWGGVLYIFGNEIYTYLSQMLLGFMPDWLNTQGTAQSILNGIIPLYFVWNLFSYSDFAYKYAFFHFLHALYRGICAGKKLPPLTKGGVWLTA